MLQGQTPVHCRTPGDSYAKTGAQDALFEDHQVSILLRSDRCGAMRRLKKLELDDWEN